MEKKTVAIITVSDRSSRKERDDLSGPEIRKWSEKMGFEVNKEVIVSDDLDQIILALADLSQSGVNLILTTGGTGFSPRDNTPEATRSVIQKEVPGFTEVMRMKSMEITPRAMLSRAVSGIRDNTLIINLPGSPKAVKENLEFIEEAIPHALELLGNEITDCSIA